MTSVGTIRTKSCELTAVAILFVSLFLSLSIACAQEYPNRPIRWIVPFAPGSINDVMARQITSILEQDLGQPIVVENRAGAGGMIGTMAAAKALPDGYTLLQGGSQTHAVNVGLYRSLSYDPLKDFVPIARFMKSDLVLAVRGKGGPVSLSELIEIAKRESGKLNYGSIGRGSNSHLAMELLKKRANIDLAHIPYNSFSQMITALLTGEVVAIFYPKQPIAGHIQAGQIRALANTGDERSDENVPTMRELGYSDFVMEGWTALYAPAGTPDIVIKKIASSMSKALKDPAVLKRLNDSGTKPALLTLQEFRKFNFEEIERYRELIDLAGARIE